MHREGRPKKADVPCPIPECTSMRAVNQLPDFSVVVWIRVSERFDALRSELLSLAAEEPYEMTQYHGMADFHWGFDHISDARRLAEAFTYIAQHPEVVILRIMSRVDATESISSKNERMTRH
jgi:hypothetical protein